MENFQVGQKVLCRKVEWSRDGGTIRKIDSVGEIVSIKDVTQGHSSVFKYVVQLPSVVWCTDNDGTEVERFEPI